MLDKIFWLGHSSVKIRSDKIVYIDPWKLKKPEPADLILISHIHHDHFSLDDIGKIRKKETVIITTKDVADHLSGAVTVVKPGERVALPWITVEAVPAYNPDKSFHPRENGWVGFILTVEGRRIYYCGDTDIIPEMKDVRADIMIVPVGGTYTMTAEEAARAVDLIKPEAAVPIHYDDIVGSIKDAKRFAELCGDPVEIKPITGS
jgi:L-ascorbate metabolism protein UlaG (beta-lactamase superfamily)